MKNLDDFLGFLSTCGTTMLFLSVIFVGFMLKTLLQEEKQLTVESQSVYSNALKMSDAIDQGKNPNYIHRHALRSGIELEMKETEYSMTFRVSNEDACEVVFSMLKDDFDEISIGGKSSPSESEVESLCKGQEKTFSLTNKIIFPGLITNH